MWSGADPKTYVFYYFTNYEKYSTTGISISDISTLSQIGLIEKQLGRINAKKNTLLQRGINEYGDEFGKLMDEMAHGNLAEYISPSYNTQMTQDLSVKTNFGAGDISAIKSMIESTAQEAVGDVGFFIEQLNKLIENIYSELSNTKNLEEYRQTVIQNYINEKNIVASQFAASVIEDFLKIDGFKDLNGKSLLTGDSLERSIQKLILLAESLPSWETGIGKSFSTCSRHGIIKDGVQLFQIIGNKVAGLQNYMQSQVGQLGMLTGALTATKLFLESLNNIKIEGNYGGHSNSALMIQTAVSEKKDPKLKSDYQNSRVQSAYKKSGAEITVSNDRVALTYGFNIKQSKSAAKSSSGFRTYTINDSVEFLPMYERLFNDDSNHSFIKNLGGGHTGNTNDLSGANMDALWTQLIDTVAAANLLTSLSGNITSSTLFLVLNGKIFDIEEVLNRIMGSIMNQSGYSMSYGATMNRQRSTFLRENTMINGPTYNWFYAKQRSEKANTSMEATLQRAKMTITLSTLSSLLL